jgi:hypothetical protein
MEQILINLVAGALGGVGVGKSSPTFDLGMAGNIISGLIGGGVLGQIAAGDHARSPVGQSQRRRHHLTGNRRRRWRRYTHGDHWRHQEQSSCLTGSRKMLRA